MNINLTALPCPKCKKPNPIEARICACGHWFIKRNAVQSRPFTGRPDLLAELKLERPRFKKLEVPAAATVQPDIPPETPAVATPQVDGSSETPSTPTIVPKTETADIGDFLASVVESTPRRNRTRIVLPMAATFCLLILAAAWNGFFGVISVSSIEAPAAQTVPEPVFAPVGQNAASESARPEAADGLIAETPANPQEESLSEIRTLIPSLPKETEAAAEHRDVTPKLANSNAATPSPSSDEPETKPAEPAEVETVPKRAAPLAVCGDGTYSYGSSRGEMCAQRGGVSQWLNGAKAAQNPTSAKPPVGNRSYVLGPRGGCYYLGASGKKVYVDKGLCS